jgi:mono/diheme cytochrome c family protein
MKYVLAGSACHNSTVSPRRVRTSLVLVLALAPLGCHKTAVYCPPPPTSGCPDGGGPSFANDVYPNVIQPVCGRCHSPDGGEPSKPFLTYQEIYGKNGAEAAEIRNQVFDSCLMPPSNSQEMLTDAGRQTLFDWLACGAPNNPASDAGAGD